MMSENIESILLAYSGGLDTSVSIKWLQEKYGAEIITFTADLGQDDIEPKKLKQKAYNTGASKVIIADLKEKFIKNQIFAALQAEARYENKYPLATALARPVIAEEMVKVAKELDIDALAHGCTGKGNDQVRFETAFSALAPELEIIAPLRDWGFTTREEELEYAQKHDIPVKVTKESPYSIDENLWGISVECGPLEDPWNEPPADAYQWTNDPEEAPEKPCTLEIKFEEGIPVAIDGEEYSSVELVEKLNELGGKHGVGRVDMVENRLVGIKSREIYEAPAAEILLTAHKNLSEMVLDRESSHFLDRVRPKYSELVYNGLWHSPLRQALQNFLASFQPQLAGTVRMKLHKGSITVTGRKSSKSLYDLGLASYDEKDNFDHSAAAGFIKLWSLPLQVVKQQENEENGELKEDTYDVLEDGGAESEGESTGLEAAVKSLAQ